MMNTLLESRMKDFVILDVITRPDGFGGFDEVMTEGAPFKAAAVIKSNTEAQIAYQTGTKRIYTVVTYNLVKLRPGMKIRMVEDGLTLEVTSNSTDMTTPEISNLDLSQASAKVVDV